MGLTGFQLRPQDISKYRPRLVLLLSGSERAAPSPHSGGGRDGKERETGARHQAMSPCKHEGVGSKPGHVATP